MNADAALHETYQEWRRLAEAEGDAIRTENWPAVAECQKAMERLQSRIIHCAGEVRKEWNRTGADRAEKEKKIHTTIAELIEIERRNNSLLNLARRAAEEQLDELSEAGRTLRRVQRSYAPTPDPVWTSFS